MEVYHELSEWGWTKWLLKIPSTLEQSVILRGGGWGGMACVGKFNSKIIYTATGMCPNDLWPYSHNVHLHVEVKKNFLRTDLFIFLNEYVQWGCTSQLTSSVEIR